LFACIFEAEILATKRRATNKKICDDIVHAMGVQENCQILMV